MTAYTDIKGRTHRVIESEPTPRDAEEVERLLDEFRRLLAHSEV